MKELTVQVALFGIDDVSDYLVFLAPFSQVREGPELIDDYLNGARRFLPMLKQGAPLIVNRDEMLWLRTSADDEAAGNGNIDASIHKPAALELADGTQIEGYVSAGDRPAESSRLSDILNDERELFLRVDGDTSVYFVNKRFIRAAMPK
ncbi:MAG: hypothetical protein ACYC7A_18795 [Thermoanaerobaculia bacterium]